MTNPELSRRALPPPLVVGLVMTATHLLLSLVVQCCAGLPMSASPVIAALTGVGSVQIAYGLWQLADRHAGAARRGLRIAAVASATTCVLQLAAEVSISFDVRWWQTPGLSVVIRYGLLSALLATAFGLPAAVWRRRPALGAAILFVWIGGLLVSVFGMPLVSSLGLGFRGMILLSLAVSAAPVGMLTAVVRALAGEPRAVDLARVGAGLRHVARVLRGAGAVMVVVTAALVVLASRGSGHALAESVLWTIAVALGVVVFAGLGLALLGAGRERRAAVGAYSLALLGALALGCGRLLLAAVPELWRSKSHGQGDLVSLALFAVPVAAVAGSAMLAWTISAYARRSGRNELRDRASLHAYCVIAALVVSPVILVKLADRHASVAVLFALVVCVVHVGLLARLCVAAAQAVEGRSELPEARLISA